MQVNECQYRSSSPLIVFLLKFGSFCLAKVDNAEKLLAKDVIVIIGRTVYFIIS